jgi:hypothetical protein
MLYNSETAPHLYKSGDKSHIKIYRPVALLSSCTKLLGQCNQLLFIHTLLTMLFRNNMGLMIIDL